MNTDFFGEVAPRLNLCDLPYPQTAESRVLSPNDPTPLSAKLACAILDLFRDDAEDAAEKATGRTVH